MEFLRYPHLIATFFNRCAFGPPKPFTVPSTWTWIGHPVSGLIILTLRPIQTWFPFGSVPYEHLTLLVVLTRRTVLQKVRSQPCGLPLFVSTRFQVLFHSPPGVLFTFPSQYCFTIGHQGVFRLGGVVPPASHRVSRVPWYSGSCSGSSAFAYWAFTVYGLLSQNNSASITSIAIRSPQPRRTRSSGLASFPFARRY